MALPEPFTILIVDDSCITRLVVQHVLRGAGLTSPKVRIIEAQNGMEGYLAVIDEHIDMIFSDMHMPSMSGLEMVEQIRARKGSTPPVIFVTSEIQEDILERARALGAQGIITKPFTQESFQAILQQVLAKISPP